MVRWAPHRIPLISVAAAISMSSQSHIFHLIGLLLWFKVAFLTSKRETTDSSILNLADIEMSAPGEVNF